MARGDRTINEVSGTVNGSVVQAEHVTIQAPVRDVLTEAVDRLARAVGTRWQREEEQRRVHDPFPLPVRWHAAPEGITDYWENILRLPPGAVAEPLVLTGLDRIVDVQRALASRRLVVLGGAGSGKTVLALRFVLDLLAVREPADPVPVIFGLSSWNPTTTPLRDWLAAQLARDHPGLAAQGHDGGTLAAGLIGADRVLPVLDGFDELGFGLHRPALEALNATTLPLLLTSRPDEYTAAVAATDVLTAAAGVVLADLTLDDVAAYLPRAAATRTWDTVLADLRRNPDSDLASVLTTPLMVTLARATYGDTPDHDPAELLDREHFPTAEAIEHHLLDTFVPSVYGAPTRWTADQARYHLRHLAHQLGGARDLAWWRFGATMSRPVRALVVGAACAIGVALLNIALNLLAFLALFGTLTWFMVWSTLLETLVDGVLAGTAFAIAHLVLARADGEGIHPSHMRIRVTGQVTPTRSKVLTRFLLGATVGGAFGLANGLVIGLLSPVVHGTIRDSGSALIYAATMGYVFALPTGLGLAVITALESPLDIASAAGPTDLRNVNRTNVLGRFVLFSLVYGSLVTLSALLLIRLPEGSSESMFFSPVAVVRLALLTGVGGGLCYCLALTAWGQWLLFARICLPLTGRLPRSLPTFLDDATSRGVLRQAGAVYQFRHARLQDRLVQPR